MNRNLFNLEKLIRSGQERVRLTKQLQEIIAAAADEIAKAVPARTVVQAAGELWGVDEFSANVGSRKALYLMRGNMRGIGNRVVFDAAGEPGDTFYLYGDYSCQLENATRDEFLFVANNLPEIIAAFQADQEQVNASLREAFERLKAQAGDV
jgi:hypothetical protein